MKFKKNIIFFVFIFIYLINFTITLEGGVNYSTNKEESDVFKEIQGLIKKYSEQKMKNSNIDMKRRLIGILPEGYPKETVERALRIRKDRKRWNKFMMIPTELYRMCLYPSAKVNYEKWCNNVFLGSKSKITSNITSNIH
jgi:hypothetical protein